MSTIDNLEEIFNKTADMIFNELKNDEECTVTLSGEESLFTRINNAKIRQVIAVDQGYININFISNNKSTDITIPFSKNIKEDRNSILLAIKTCRKECEQLPIDPYIVKPKDNGQSRENYLSDALDDKKIVTDVMKAVDNKVDYSGIITSGSLVRANNNSKGQRHWFSNESFLIDYSLYTDKQKAVKGIYADRKWNNNDFQLNLEESIKQLSLLITQEKKIKPGKYRCYFAPQAVADFIDMLSWGAINMRYMKEGECAFKKLVDKKAALSNLFSLEEDFKLGMSPKFNDYGEVSNDCLPLIINGKLENMLVNSRTAKEYDLKSNNADISESMRSPVVKTGNLEKKDILKELDTGIYISNVHYLNWSNRINGRITGMTRYACFWVENGMIQAPIADMRFDESLYNFFGDNLINLTSFRELFPNTSTYVQRSTGAVYCPGMLVNDFTFTL